MEIKTTSDGGLETSHKGFKYATKTQTVIITAETADALRKQFQAERDKELGWWRYPDNPDELVRRAPICDSGDRRCVKVLDERTGWSTYCYESETFRAAARAYFEAHPETKPWHDAQPGEVWLITAAGKKPEPMIATTYGTFTAELSEYTLNDEAIITGSRIYPEEAGDNDE